MKQIALSCIAAVAFMVAVYVISILCGECRDFALAYAIFGAFAYALTKRTVPWFVALSAATATFTMVAAPVISAIAIPVLLTSILSAIVAFSFVVVSRTDNGGRPGQALTVYGIEALAIGLALSDDIDLGIVAGLGGIALLALIAAISRDPLRPQRSDRSRPSSQGSCF